MLNLPLNRNSKRWHMVIFSLKCLLTFRKDIWGKIKSIWLLKLEILFTKLRKTCKIMTFYAEFASKSKFKAMTCDYFLIKSLLTFRIDIWGKIKSIWLLKLEIVFTKLRKTCKIMTFYAEFVSKLKFKAMTCGYFFIKMFVNVQERHLRKSKKYLITKTWDVIHKTT